MDILFKFKDGMVVENNGLGNTMDMEVDGSGVDFLSLLVKGKKNNSTIKFNGGERKYEDLYSVEIIL